jgi:hypothetical protein
MCVQDPDEGLRLELRLHGRVLEEAGAALPPEFDDVRTWQTTVARMPGTNASAAGFSDGSFVRLHAGPGSRCGSGCRFCTCKEQIFQAYPIAYHIRLVVMITVSKIFKKMHPRIGIQAFRGMLATCNVHADRKVRGSMRFSCRGGSAVAAVQVDDSISLAHMQVSQAILQTLALQPHRRVAVRPCPPSQPQQPPVAVVLHPVSLPETGETEAPSLRQLSPRQLQLLFAAWLQAQSSQCTSLTDINSAVEGLSLHGSAAQAADSAAPAGSDLQNGGHARGDDSVQSAAERSVPLQDGTAMWLEFPSQRQPTTFFLELLWPPGAPRPSGALPMQPLQFLRLGVNVELGKGVELPLVSTAHPSAATSLQNGGLQEAEGAAVGFGEKWAAEFVRPAMERLLPLLHDISRRMLWAAKAPPPGGLLVCGPAGSGER